MSDVAAVACSTCGRDLPENCKYCRFCGTQKAFNCPRCESNNEMSSLICAECGLRLDWIGRNSCCIFGGFLSFLAAFLLTLVVKSRPLNLILLGLLTFLLFILAVDAKTNVFTQRLEHERLKTSTFTPSPHHKHEEEKSE